MKIRYISDAGAASFPPQTQKIIFSSEYDGAEDWVLWHPGDTSKNLIVYLHGSFSHADQIFSRPDVRDFWWTRIQAGNHPLLSLNMRGTTYMSPAVAVDLTDLLHYCREEKGCEKIILLGGSGGASSAMAYAVLHPENIDGVIAMGMCDIFHRLDYARNSDLPLLQNLAETVFAAYGGTIDEIPDVFRERSVLAHTDRLTMPIVLTMGEKDPVIPVEQTRAFVQAMQDKENFTYYEIPGGDHDSALWVDVDLQTLTIKTEAASS